MIDTGLRDRVAIVTGAKQKFFVGGVKKILQRNEPNPGGNRNIYW
jgi:hypothetical protein